MTVDELNTLRELLRRYVREHAQTPAVVEAARHTHRCIGRALGALTKQRA